MSIQSLDFKSIYITSFYWVIMTFTSVGYGDVTGSTILEYVYQVVVMMVGICFFGYMTGTFQQLLSDFNDVEPVQEYQEELDQWLINLNHAVRDRDVSAWTYSAIREFHSCNFYKNTDAILHTQLFQNLKPRMKKLVLDLIFKPYYKIFETALKGCQIEFMRMIFEHCQYEYYYCNWDQDQDIPNSPKAKHQINVLDNKNDKEAIIWFKKSERPDIITAN